MIRHLAAAEVTRLTLIASEAAQSTSCFTLHARRSTVLFSALFLSAFGAFAQPVPKITSISPEWIQRGTTNELTIVGDNLGSVSGFIFSGEAGLSATNVPPPAAPQPAISIESAAGTITRSEAAPTKDNKRLVVKLSAAADAKLGAREFRVVAPGGVSEPLTLNVGHLPEIAESGSNNS